MKRPGRTEREAAALRANLLKRKDQARRRAAPDDAPKEPAEPEDAKATEKPLPRTLKQ
jgi:hypothetical protein